ncbi:PAP2-domain-containing protein [Rhodofomes roseus]|uniref:PAP2-domain-containing protein n=1 Tax=Rhodofomes roseus TaxID=34475 RepID=A0ABQ8K7F5_9APHY|nr:PAP2-domain-containing protein [Rhodofomes roseus]KAH9832618.1 PAP2-domain-containing protein [Rhodofomes roseus]
MSEPILERRIALDLTYVLYPESSQTSLVLALLTLSPILINPAYAVLSVQTRELFFIEMWAGQMLCEALNWVIKHAIQEDRPTRELGDGFGFPSSHSQWMGYFSTFLIWHLTYRHRFASSGWRFLDLSWRIAVYMGLVGWALAVTYSRYYLSYHTPRQVIWGLSIGVLFGTWYYAVVEVLPTMWPRSSLGRARAAVLENPVSTWFRIRDGWAVWSDGGKEIEWLRWRAEWSRSAGMNSGGLKRE